jgi:DNA-binding response OmpR family regulator
MSLNRILLISDNSKDVGEVTAYLKSKGLTLRMTYSPERGRSLFDEYNPQVLLLSFHTLELAKDYAVSLSRDPTRTQMIVLCKMTEVEAAAQLVTDRQFDDYVVFRPVYDIHRLSICVQQALERAAQFETNAVTPNLSGVQITPQARAGALRFVPNLHAPSKPAPLKTFPRREDTLHRGPETDPLSVLVVEDDPRSLKLLTAILELEGYTVQQASTGGQAMVQVTDQRPDLSLMDIMLPDVNGLELTQHLKANPELGDIPIVMVSASSTKDNALLSARWGASDFIVKPIRQQVVLEKVRRWLAR